MFRKPNNDPSNWLYTLIIVSYEYLLQIVLINSSDRMVTIAFKNFKTATMQITILTQIDFIVDYSFHRLLKTFP